MMRKIIHIDMDAFYASVEQRDFPEYRGKPLAVGGSRDRGVVAAASYEARKYGVKSAMASSLAYQRCPDIIFVKPRFEVYKEVSSAIREIFSRYTDLIEPLSLDEAYLDVTENKRQLSSATIIATEIKQTIKAELSLTASAGISINKFLAKIASDMDKPDGLYVIRPEEIESFIAKLPVKKFYGVGKVTAEKLHKMGVYFGRDLKQYSLQGLTSRFGKMGYYLYDSCRGIDNRKVNASRERKSVGAERTFSKDIRTYEALRETISNIAELTYERLVKSNKKGRTVTLKLKFEDFTQVTRSITLIEDLDDLETLIFHTLLLSEEFVDMTRGVRLVGVGMSNFTKIKKNNEHKSTVITTQLTLDL